MARRGQFLLQSFGVLLHLMYLSSVFYIYFKSPILPGLDHIRVESNSPAERLVLFVADGLRADKLFHRDNEKRAPFLRKIIKQRGRWGVSHTRVPTESRVGHVSMMAGTYEDVSAITNGWKDNPVEFDSFFNQSYKTWCWGSPDILNIFQKQSSENFQAFSYHSQEIDFASKDPSMLDTWVFEKVPEFFASASSELQKELHKSQSVFFLHLLGIDTTGHMKKPDSEDYLRNIQIVDKGIEKMTSVFETFFNNDGKTVYVVTSDHGMTSWGAHGTGLQSETETPFIAWGAGIREPTRDRNINKDSQSLIWGLEDYKRTDINQIDLAPLMSFLIGTSFPTNSVGQLPYQVLNVDEKQKALGMLHNLHQIKKQYDAHEMRTKKSSMAFDSFDGIDKNAVSSVESLVNEGDYGKAIDVSSEWISVFLEGIDYYHRYNRLWLSVCVNLAFVLWLLVLLATILNEYSSFSSKGLFLRKVSIAFLRSRLFLSIYTGVIILLSFLLVIKGNDLSFIVYTMSPLLVLTFILTRAEVLWNDFNNVKNYIESEGLLTPFCYVFFVAIGLEILVKAFFGRESLSIIAVCLAFLPWIKLTISNENYNIIQMLACVLFTFTSLALGYFPQLQVVHNEQNYMLVMLAAFLVGTCGMVYSFLCKDENNVIISMQTGLVIICALVKLHSVRSIEHGNGLPLLNQIFSWSIVVLMPGLVFLTNSNSASRLISSILSLQAIYILTSISYEALFLLVLTVQMLSWVALEILVFSDKAKQKETLDAKPLTLDHLRISFMFVYFIFISFFGTGNVASINSFDVASTYCFQTIFNPWIQGTILVVKTLVPLLMVTVIFRSMQSLTSLPMRGVFLLILILTDVMAMHFFFLVKDEGSWLDIGQSLSHFVINLGFVIFLVPIYDISYFITGSISIKSLKTHVS